MSRRTAGPATSCRWPAECRTPSATSRTSRPSRSSCTRPARRWRASSARWPPTRPEAAARTWQRSSGSPSARDRDARTGAGDGSRPGGRRLLSPDLGAAERERHHEADHEGDQHAEVRARPGALAAEAEGSEQVALPVEPLGAGVRDQAPADARSPTTISTIGTGPDVAVAAGGPVEVVVGVVAAAQRGRRRG